MKNVIRIVLIILTVSVNIGCDQVSKTIVRDKVSYGERISLVQRHLTLTKVENTGAFLSLGDAWPPLVKTTLLLILPMLALLLGLAYLFFSTKVPRLVMLGTSFMIGGGIGNLIDRATYGSVTDFLHIQAGLFQTGVFNMADVSVMIGAGFILLNAFLKEGKNQFI